MKIDRIELVHARMPLVAAFRTSYGSASSRETFLLRLVSDAAEGWAEFAGDPDPLYSRNSPPGPNSCSETISSPG